MEVKSGQIKAISNLSKTKSNQYAEKINIAVSHQMEPGSTFKTASMMAYFEDFGGSIEDTIDCKNGQHRFRGSPIDTYDSKDLGVVSIKSAFAHSSNISITEYPVSYIVCNNSIPLNKSRSYLHIFVNNFKSVNEIFVHIFNAISKVISSDNNLNFSK